MGAHKGCIPWNKGIPQTNEVKRKLSSALMGRVVSIETRKKMSDFRKGKPNIYVLGKHWKLSEETCKKMSQAQKGIKKLSGEKHPKWIKDRTKLKISDKKCEDVKYIYWARQVKLRDNWKCKIADINCKGRLESHHILPWRDFVELRYNINNGITLCVAHHPRKRKDEAELSPFFQQLVAEMK